MMRLRKWLKLYSFDGRKKYFWAVATIIKAFLLIDRIAFVFLYINQLKRVAELTASLPVAITVNMTGFAYDIIFFIRKYKT